MDASNTDYRPIEKENAKVLKKYLQGWRKSCTFARHFVCKTVEKYALRCMKSNVFSLGIAHRMVNREWNIHL